VAHGTKVMLLISTDKAINPSSVMGASKRVAESYCQALGSAPDLSRGTRFVAVRFGNVLDSTGSVVPLFRQQLERGGPLTVTHRDMVRYFMTVREAVELVLQAAVLPGRNGEVYILDMGQPVKILDLAEQMIKLAGLRPYQDIKIEFTGLRPGEKMFEELFHSSEASNKTAHESIWLANPPQVPMETLAAKLKRLYEACEQRDGKKTVEMLKELVPEYKADSASYAKPATKELA
jgi:FlaA1/EpsC-like NDP-sugar epimerase